MKTFCGKVRIGAIAILGMVTFAVIAIVVSSAPRASVSAKQPAPSAGAKAAVPAAHNNPPRFSFAKLPMSFEPNLGQSGDPQVKFLSRGPDYTLFLTPSRRRCCPCGYPHLVRNPLPEGSRERARDGSEERPKMAVVRIALKGAAAAPQIVRFRDRMAGRSNYFIGNDPRSGIPMFPTTQVELKNVYPGIDLILLRGRANPA